MKRSVLLILSIWGCTMHPRYQRPQEETPVSWRTPTDDTYCATEIGFWKQFGDPILDAYVQEGIEHNQDLQTAIYTVKEFEARYGIVSSQLYPQIQVPAESGRVRFSENFITTVPGVPFQSNYFELIGQVTYLADVWGKVRSASQSAYAEMLSQVEVRRAMIITVVTGIVHSYIEMRKFDAQLEIAEQTLDTRITSYNLAKIRFELGLTSEMQVEQAKSEVEEAQVSVDEIKIKVALQEDLLSLLIGKPSMTPDRGKPLTELILPTTLPAYLPSDMVSQRPDILKAEQKLIAANADIGVARAKFFPEFNLLANYGYQSSQLSTLFTNASSVWQYAVNIVQEVFTGGKLTSGLRLSKAKKTAMLHEYQNAVLQGFKEINDALISHSISKDLVKEQKERVETLSTYFKLATYQYNEGLTDYLTYLDAERHLFSAQLDYAAALGYGLTTFIQIYGASGGGWVLDIDATLNPKETKSGCF